MVSVHLRLNTYSSTSELVKTVNQIEYIPGERNTADAIKLLREELFSTAYGDRSEVPNIAILVTNGVATINKLETIPEAEMSRDVGIVIFAIGIGMSNSEVLHGIAGSGKNAFFIDKFEDLEPNLNSIKTSICNGSMFYIHVQQTKQ